MTLNKIVYSLIAHLYTAVFVAIIFVYTTGLQLIKRSFGIRSIISAQINDHKHKYGDFYIPSKIQYKFRFILFFRSMLNNPFLFKKKAQRLHSEFLSHLIEKKYEVIENGKSPDYLDFDYILDNSDWFYENYVKIQKPVVIRGVNYEKDLWTIEYIRSIWGNNPMMVHDLANKGKSHKMTLNEMIEKNLKGDGCYYMSFNRSFFESNRKLIKKSFSIDKINNVLKRNYLFGESVKIEAQLFISTKCNNEKIKHSTSSMHCSNNFNMFYNIKGRKKWILIDPEFSICCYPTNHLRNMAGYLSLIKSPSLLKPEINKYPLYKYVPKYEVDLEEGDVLFVPCWWWHSVESLTDESLSLAIRFGHQAFGSLFPITLKDPNNLFTTLQVMYPMFKKEVYTTIYNKIYSKITKYDGSFLRAKDITQETDKDKSLDHVLKNKKTYNIWVEESKKIE